MKCLNGPCRAPVACGGFRYCRQWNAGKAIGLSAEAFAAKAPIGTPIKYYPIAGEEFFVHSKVRSEPWNLGHGALVVLIEDRTGCVDVTHIEIMEAVNDDVSDLRARD